MCLVSGIRTLTLDFTCVKHLPAAAGIVRHAKTLKLLNVHAGRNLEDGDDELVYDYSSFADICKNCKDVEQISVAFPSVSIVGNKQDSFVNFEVSSAIIFHSLAFLAYCEGALIPLCHCS
jgi:hypothetical protein